MHIPTEVKFAASSAAVTTVRHSALASKKRLQNPTSPIGLEFTGTTVRIQRFAWITEECCRSDAKPLQESVPDRLLAQQATPWTDSGAGPQHRCCSVFFSDIRALFMEETIGHGE